MPYIPFHADWKNEPNDETPITAEALEYIEKGVGDAHAILDGRLSPGSLDEAYLAGAVAAKTAAETARTQAQTAKTQAETAKTAAEAARDEVVIAVPAQIDWTGTPTLASSAVSSAKWIKVRLTGNATVNVPNGASAKAYTVTLDVIQDATGNRTLTLNNVLWPYGVAPVITTAAASRDLIFLTWTGASWVGTVGAQGIAIASGGGA